MRAFFLPFYLIQLFMILNIRSEKNLAGVNSNLVRVVRRASQMIDAMYPNLEFIVTEGLRTIERQKQLVSEKKSQTMLSKHLTGHAVDLAAVWKKEVVWDAKYYAMLADVIQESARELNVDVEWGSAWNFILNKETRNPDELMKVYIENKRKLGGKPFLDSPHFEIDPIKYKKE